MFNEEMDSYSYFRWLLNLGIMILIFAGANATSPAAEPVIPAGDNSFFIGSEIPFNLSPSYAHVFYGKDSIKEAADVRGVYGFIDTKLDLIEVGWDMFDLQFKDQTHLTQNDYTLAYTNYWVPNWKFRIGNHYINSTSDISDAAYLLFGGVHYYEIDSFDIGYDVTFSHYRNNPPPVDIIQLNPHIGWYWANTENWFLRTDITGYSIFTNNDVGLGKKNFYSAEARVSAGSGRLSYSAFGWAGQQTFAVRNNGFVVYNLSELHKGGFGGDVTYKFTENTSVKGFINNELFKDFVNDKDTTQLVVGLLLSHTF